MLTNIKNVRAALANSHAYLDDIKYLVRYRRQFMEDPVGSVNKLPNDSELLSDLIKYKDIFSVGANLPVAKDDALDIINTAVVKQLDKLNESENSVINALTGTNKATSDLVKLITTSPVLTLINARLTKILTASPFMELTEKQLPNKLNPIMSKAGVNTDTYVNWLYGLYRELTDMGLNNLFNAIDYSKLDTYINKELSTLTNDDNGVVADALSVSDIDDHILTTTDNAYKIIANYVVKPDYVISGIDCIIYIAEALREGFAVMKNNPYVHKFDLPNVAGSRKDVINNAVTDATSVVVDELSEFVDKYPLFLHRLEVAANDVINANTALYNELLEFTAIQHLVSTAISVSDT